MYLFINTISTPAVYILFDDTRTIISEEFHDIKGRESEKFLESLQEFLTKNRCEFKNLQGIVVVNGPGGFTAMRIITLTINTLVFVHHTPLYSIDYFTLGYLSGWSYPILVRANRGEYCIQKNKDTPPELIPIPDILPGTYFGMGDINDFTNGIFSIQSEISYDRFCKNISLQNPLQKVDPFYIKKPNIS